MSIKLTVDEMNNRIREYSLNIHLLEEYKKENNYYYKIHCDTCNVTYDINREWIKNAIYMFKAGKMKNEYCPVCNNNIIIKGVNDISTTASWMMDYIKNPEDAYIYSKSSNKKIMFKCPICRDEKECCINNVYYFGFSCNQCDDNVSIPNKFIRSLFKQLETYYYKPEYKSNWTNNYIYDLYFELKDKNNNINKYAIEMDGVQHYKKIWDDIDIIKQRDLKKNILAQNNNVTLIRIDCRNTDLDIIKNKICNSILSDIFNLNDVDWDSIYLDCKTSLTSKICDYKNQHKELSCNEISKHFKTTRQTIYHHLKKGYKLNICKDSEEYHINNNKIYFNYNTPIIVYDNDKKYIGTFDTLDDCERQLNIMYPSLNFNQYCIREVLKWHLRKYLGFYFEFKDIDVSKIYKDNELIKNIYFYKKENRCSIPTLSKTFNLPKHIINHYLIIGEKMYENFN